MSLERIYLRRSVFALMLGALLTACGSAATPVTPAPSAAAQPSAVASAAPSAAPSTQPSPSTLPSAIAQPSPIATEQSSAADVLPAPLVFADRGQLMRLERDGKTITPLTDERPGQPDILAVIDFDVSPVDGSLAYVVQGQGGNMLVRSDANGDQRTVLLPSSPVGLPRWSPDGTQLALRISPPATPGSGSASGVYIMPASGGVPQLIQPDDADPSNGTVSDARGYMPQSWSPDGSRLLLSAYGLTLEVCSAAVKEIESGALVPIQAPERMVSGCASGQWSADGQTLYIQMARPGPQPPVPGLWQADVRTGAITPFLQGEFEDGTHQLVLNQRPLQDGSVYAFIANVKQLPEPFSGTTVQYQLRQQSQTDGLPLRDDQLPVVGQALWAADNSGVLVDMFSTTANDMLTAWVPLDGGPVVELGRFLGEAKRWATN